MKDNWFKRNYKTIIRISYIIPILVAAGISVYHVISWYDITNPISWAVYLSVGIEIAALSALAGMTAKMNKWVYLPFIIVTFIQILGNIFASYSYIDITGDGFKAWVELFNPMFESFGWVEDGNLMTHKRILGILGGIFIPLISLSFLHLLISFNEKENTPEDGEKTENTPPKPKLPDTDIEKPELPEDELDDWDEGLEEYTKEVAEKFKEKGPQLLEQNPSSLLPDEEPEVEILNHDTDDIMNRISEKHSYLHEEDDEDEPVFDGQLELQFGKEPPKEVEAIETIDLPLSGQPGFYSAITETIEPIEVEVEEEIIEEPEVVERPVDRKWRRHLGETEKQVVTPAKREPVVPNGEITREEIKEVKDRGFSVNIPKNNITRLKKRK